MNITKNKALRIGIDLGGTKIEIVVLNQAGDIIFRQRLPTPQGDYKATLNRINELVNLAHKSVHMPDDIPLGVGTPGAVSMATGLLKNCNSTILNDKPFAKDLSGLTSRAVRIANDADCFALSEASDGAGAGAHSVFGVILGTGVGGGIVYDGKLLQGINAICGEWGHTTLPLNGLTEVAIEPLAPHRQCYCGRVDCVETWLSGPGFETSYQTYTGMGVRLSGREISDLLAVRDVSSVAIFNQYVNMLALALSTVINIVDPDTIVLGGGMANLPGICTELHHHLRRYVFSDRVDTRIVPAKFGDSSGVRGAAWLWLLSPV